MDISVGTSWVTRRGDVARVVFRQSGDTWCVRMPSGEQRTVPASFLVALEHEGLARAFARQLSTDLGDRDLRRVVKRNAKEKSAEVCHSHDFCDANETMLEAFQSVMKREPAFLSGPESADGQRDIALWNAAWNLAKERQFWIAA